jgi:phospholipase C
VRGHRLLNLAPGLLLEWSVAFRDDGAPRPADCAGALYAVWSYTLETADGAAAPRDPFAATPVSSGCWPDIGAGHDIVGDGQHLFVRERATGELRSYAVDPAAADPLAAPPVDTRPAGGTEATLLKSLDWTPPTRSSIRHLVLVVQDGRSFDSYFGRACQGTPSEDGTPLAREDFPAGCEAIPASPPGAPGGCAPLDATTDAHVPNGHPLCMRDKMDGGRMDQFATPHLVPCPSPLDCAQETCGDPLDIACASSDPDSPIAPYHELAMQGALADRMFQTFAYLDGALPPTLSGSDVVNLLYVGAARFVPDIFGVNGTPFLTVELGRVEIPWAFYAGGNNLRQIVFAPTTQPDFHDPVWYPYRSAETGELARDIDLGQLPAISVVLPDASNPTFGEGPGHSPANGIAFVRGVADAIAGSPYAKDTLVLITYVTAGGYYDHVRPPPAPDRSVDAVDGSAATPVPYGPRVPMLALGTFARSGHVSHVQLELSSLAVFIEWNWLQSRGLKIRGEPSDMRSYRDGAANNVGSLLDPAATGEPHVPAHRED